MRVHLLPAIGDAPLCRLNPSDLQQLYASKLEDGRRDGSGGLSTATVRQLHNIMHAALKQAVREGLVARNIADAVAPPRVTKLKQIKPFSRQEVGRLLEASRGGRLHAAYLLAIASGMRRGEVLALRWEDTDLEAGTVQVRRSLARLPEDGKSGLLFLEPKTAKSRRLIPIPQEAVRELQRHKARQGQEKLLLGAAYHDEGLVFATPDGRPIDPMNFSRSFKSLVKKAGLAPRSLHDTRHTFATLLLESNEHPKVVQELLGHAKVGLTLDTYSHCVPALKERAAEKLNDILRDAQSATGGRS